MLQDGRLMTAVLLFSLLEGEVGGTPDKPESLLCNVKGFTHLKHYDVVLLRSVNERRGWQGIGCQSSWVLCRTVIVGT